MAFTLKQLERRKTHTIALSRRKTAGALRRLQWSAQRCKASASQRRSAENSIRASAPDHQRNRQEIDDRRLCDDRPNRATGRNVSSTTAQIRPRRK